MLPQPTSEPISLNEDRRPRYLGILFQTINCHLSVPVRNLFQGGQCGTQHPISKTSIHKQELYTNCLVSEDDTILERHNKPYHRTAAIKKPSSQQTQLNVHTIWHVHTIWLHRSVACSSKDKPKITRSQRPLAGRRHCGSEWLRQRLPVSIVFRQLSTFPRDIVNRN